MPVQICSRNYVNCGCDHSPPENVRHPILPPAPSPESETDEVAVAAAQLLGVELPPAPPPVLRKTRCRFCSRQRRKADIAILDAPLRSQYLGIVPTGAKVCIAHLTRDIDRLQLCGECNHYSYLTRIRLSSPPRELSVCRECASQYTSCGACRSYTLTPIPVGRFLCCEGCAPRHYECQRCHRLRDTRDRQENPAYGAETCVACWEGYYRQCARCDVTFEIGESDRLCQELCIDCQPDVSGYSFPWSDYHDGAAYSCESGDAPDAINFILIPRRRFGVELEFSRGGRLAGRYIADETGWGACPDGTHGVVQEFKSPPLAGDEGLGSVERLCELANKCQLDVSRQCGFHLHVDMREESDARLLRVAGAYAAFLPLWKCFVPPSRRKNRFCNADLQVNGRAETLLSEGRKPWMRGDGNRYCAINWQAYRRHRTAENRLHTGTMNSSKVTNWIRANVQFVEWARQSERSTLLDLDSASAPEKFRYLRDNGVWTSDVCEFYLHRAKKFGVDLLSDGTGPGEIVIPPGPTGPNSPGWEWTAEDRRLTAAYHGLRESQVSLPHISAMFNSGLLSRKPVDSFVAEVKAGIIAGYVENTTEADP